MYLNKSKGRENLKIDVVHTNTPRKPQTTVDKDGDRRLNWDWFTQYFDKGDYDGVGFHFTDYYKDKWNLSVRGSKNSLNKDYPQFFFACGKEEAPTGYPDSISNFVRLLIHEISHFDEDLDNELGDGLPQKSVHIWDYELKAIHFYPQFVDYRGYNIKKKVNKLVSDVINFVSKVLSS